MCLFFVAYSLLIKRRTRVFHRSPTVRSATWHSRGKKIDVKKLTENIERVYYCIKFHPFKCLLWRGLATPPGVSVFFTLKHDKHSYSSFTNYLWYIVFLQERISLLPCKFELLQKVWYLQFTLPIYCWDCVQSTESMNQLQIFLTSPKKSVMLAISRTIDLRFFVASGFIVISPN